MQRLRTHNLGSALIALAAGGLTTLGFAPFSLAPSTILGPALVLWLWHRTGPSRALRDGWLYGVGLLGSGVSWLHISIDQFVKLQGGPQYRHDAAMNVGAFSSPPAEFVRVALQIDHPYDEVLVAEASSKSIRQWIE